jgi:hypothetical protein
MSFDTDKMHKLKGKGFDKLYATNPTKWKEIVNTARDYAKTWVGPNEKVLHGDVVSALVNAIKVDPEFETHVKAIPQKYWVTWFAEFLVEQVYPQTEPAQPKPKPQPQPTSN